MKILFMGTPDFAVLSLRALQDAGHDIIGVVTQPDRPKGRGKQMAFSPVKEYAVSQGFPVHQPERISRPESMENLISLAPDLIVTAAFGQLIPTQLLDSPRYGSVNVHASLLPRWRGGAPIHRAILAGDSESGVTIMRMVKKLDAGNILTQVQTPILDSDTVGSLHDRLAELGAELLLKTLPKLTEGLIEEQVQDESLVTYAPNLTKEDEQIDWSRSAREIWNQVRGLNPWPGAFTTLQGDILKIWQCKLADETFAGIQGRMFLKSGSVFVETGKGTLQLLEVQPAGKKRMNAADFARGLRTDQGDLQLQ